MCKPTSLCKILFANVSLHSDRTLGHGCTARALTGPVPLMNGRLSEPRPPAQSATVESRSAGLRAYSGPVHAGACTPRAARQPFAARGPLPFSQRRKGGKPAANGGLPQPVHSLWRNVRDVTYSQSTGCRVHTAPVSQSTSPASGESPGSTAWKQRQAVLAVARFEGEWVPGDEAFESVSRPTGMPARSSL